MGISEQRQFDLAFKQYRTDIAKWARESGRWKYLPGYTATDLEAEMWEVLLLAVRSYDPSKGSKFGNYFRTMRNNHYTDMVRKASTIMRTSEKDWEDFEAPETVGSDTYNVNQAVLKKLLNGESAEEIALCRLETPEIFRDVI